MKSQYARLARIMATAITGVMLAACGGEEDGQKTTIAADDCEALNGATFVADTLGEGGLTMNGVVLSHWSAYFSDGVVSFAQSDFVLPGSYSCETGAVIVEVGDMEPQALAFNDGYQSFSFAPLGGEVKNYIRQASTESSYESCQLVMGKRYTEVLDNSGNGENEDAIPFGLNFYEFGESQQVTYTVGGDAVVSGIYDCSTNEMHVHGTENDTNPTIVKVKDDGAAITVMQGDFSMELTLDRGEPAGCSKELAPVCAIKEENIQCFTTPCPTGSYKTYSNRCLAENENSEIAFEGECGEREGELYTPPVACITLHEPVCGTEKLATPCLTVPCPAVVHKTYGNDCELDAAKSKFLFDGECGELEGTPVGAISQACTLEYAPVCGKVSTGIVCVTTPCDTHEYKTFGNSCEAEASLANVVSVGECGDLEGAVGYGEPPIVVTPDLPQSEKVTSISDVRIDGDVLSVTLGYSGCNQQHFEVFAGQYVLESFPPQVEIAFKPLVEDSCLAVFTSELRFDLLPLKAFLDDGDPDTEQEFILRNLGVSYKF